MSLLDKLVRDSSYIVKFTLGLYFICILYANQDRYISFQYSSKYYDMLPGIINSIIEKPTSLILVSTDISWNLHYLKTYNKIPLIKELKEVGLNKGTFIHSLRYRDKNYSKNNKYFDLSIPLVMTINAYKTEYLVDNYYYAFRTKIIKSITKKRDMN